MAGKKTSKHQKELYQAYKAGGVRAKNKAAKQARHAKAVAKKQAKLAKRAERARADEQ